MPSAEPLTQPLVVDLDGTLIKADLMWEAAAALVTRNPFNLFRLLLWLAHGLAYCKEQLAQNAPLPQADSLPYNKEFLDYLRQQQRPLILATAAHRIHADLIANHLGIFEQVLASENGINLKGSNKAERLVEKYGTKKFDYAGDSNTDIPVWQQANNVLLVNAAPALATRYPQAQVFDQRPPRLALWLRALRPHHWAKNLLIFVAVIGGHQVLSAPAMLHSLLAFVVFNLLASATYLINDIVDLPHDRHHARKCRRPLASGGISIFSSAIVAVIFMASAALLAQLLPPMFTLTAAIYILVTFAYSFKLKRLLFLDVLILSLLFTLRIIAGGAATTIELSFWLLAFAIFIFLSLAILKRYAELINNPESGRAYQHSDTQIMAMLGCASGMISMFVLAMFIDSDAISGRYTNPQYIWLAVPLMVYWIARIWLLGGRGQIGSDPLLFAVRDATSWGVGVLMLVLIYLAV